MNPREATGTPGYPEAVSERRSPIAAVVRAAWARPVGTTAVLGLVWSALQLWWVATTKHPGAFEVDEAGGIAAALRFERSFSEGLRPLAQAVFGTRNGPAVPLIALPFLVIGPRSATTALAAQCVLVVAAACAAAGIVRRLAGDAPSVLAGALVLIMPSSILSARSFQYSTGVAAFLGLALWALLASERGSRRAPMIALGAAAGAMILSRTMAASFLPAIGVAALVIVRRDRRALGNLGLAVLTALAVAGPWWAVQWNAILDYLIDNAYGPRAHYWGSVGLGQRLVDHYGYTMNDLRWFAPVLIVTLAVVVGGAVVVARRQPTATGWIRWRRGTAALWSVEALGTVALLSTANRGYWFAYPLTVLLVAGVVALAANLFDHWGPRATTPRGALLAAAGVASVVVVVAAVQRTSNGGPYPNGNSDFIESALGSFDRLHSGNLDADRRLAAADPDIRRTAAAEWWRAGLELTDEIAAIEAEVGPVQESLTGEIHLFNANTIALAQLIPNRGVVSMEVVNTLEPSDDELRRKLEPRVDGLARVLVIVEGRSLAFPDGRGRRRFLRMARQEGWEVRRTIPLPDDGDVLVLTHPDSRTA